MSKIEVLCHSQCTGRAGTSRVQLCTSRPHRAAMPAVHNCLNVHGSAPSPCMAPSIVHGLGGGRAAGGDVQRAVGHRDRAVDDGEPGGIGAGGGAGAGVNALQTLYFLLDATTIHRVPLSETRGTMHSLSIPLARSSAENAHSLPLRSQTSGPALPSACPPLLAGAGQSCLLMMDPACP